MKRALFVLVFLLCAQNAFATDPAKVQCSTITDDAAFPFANGLLSGSVATVNGNFLLDMFSVYRNVGTTVTAATDDSTGGPESWSEAKQQADSVPQQAVGIWTAKVAHSDTGVKVTNTLSGNLSNQTAVVCEFNGLNSTTWVDKSVGCTATATTSTTCTVASSNTHTGALVVGCLTVNNADATQNMTVSTPGSGVTNLGLNNDNTGVGISLRCDMYIESGTGPSSFVWAHDISTVSAAVVVTFDNATGGAGGSSASNQMNLLGAGKP